MRRSLVGLGAFAVVAAGVLLAWYFAAQPAGTRLAASAGPEPTGGTAAASGPQNSETASGFPDGGKFEFLRVVTDTSKDRPSACLRFTRPLDARPETHYGDYLQLDPAADSALRVAEDALCIDGLAFGHSYSVRIAAGMPARDGSRLAAPAEAKIEFAERPPFVGFSESGYVLARGGTAGVAIDTVNVEKVAVEVLRVGDRILPGMVSQLRSKAEGDRWTLEQMVERSARPVWSGIMEIQSAPNEVQHTAFPLAKAVPDRQPGAYLIVAANAAGLSPRSSSAKFLWQRTEDYQFAAQWVIKTDLALTTVSAADGLHVFARSLGTAQPVAGVGLDLLARDQQVLDHAVTDGQGGALFAPGLLRGAGAAAASAVFAYGTAGDFAVLDLSAPAFDLSDRGVGGRDAAGPIDAYVYTDRGIYRPGETVHAVALMRDRLGAAIPDAPLILVLRRPNGLEFKRSTLAARPAGGFALTVTLPDTASRGGWSVEALDADDKPVGHAGFEVQEFVPQRLKVTAHSDARLLRPGDPIAVAIDGLFLYGAPAAGLGAEAHLTLSADDAPFPQSAQGYRFGMPDPHFAPPEVELTVPATNSAGHTVASGTLAPPGVQNLPLKATITAGIQEPGGRVTSDEITLPIRSGGHSIGIRPRFKDDLVAEGERARFEVIAIDDDGKPMAMRLHWTLIAEDEHYDWLETDGHWSYHLSVTDKPVDSGDLAVAADRPSAIEHDVDWGSYRLEVEDPASTVTSSYRFHAGWMDTSESAETPDKVTVTVERERYAVGGTARLHIVPPFPGHLQLMVARDKVFAIQELDAPKEGVTVEVPVTEDWGSGAYVLASLYRPADGGRGHMPVRAVGLAWVGVDPGRHLMTIELRNPHQVTPRQSVAVPLHVSGGVPGEPVFITLAAVDEGILQLTRFAAPDPVGFYFGKRRLAAEIRDDYGRLLDGTMGVAGQLRSGGDEMGGASLPVVPTRSVALFSGPVAVGADGTATIPLDIPDFEGTLRLMAVAYSRSAIGRAEAPLIVRDPVVADVALPRFLAPGDQARLTLLVDNTDGAAGTYHVALAGSGAVAVAAAKPLDYALGKGERRIETVPISGLDEGVGTVTATLTGPDGLAIKRDWQIAVRGSHYPVTLATTALQPAGSSFTLDRRLLDAFVPGSVNVSLSYSRLAGIDVPGLLQSLWRYPYGCTEQLTSTAFPLLYYDDAALSGRAARDQGVHARVQAAIDRILDRQDGDGGFGLWRAGDDLGGEWLSLYALDFLLHARAAGYEVPDAALHRSFGFAEAAVHDSEAGPPQNRASHPLEDEAYAQWLLAQGHRADLGRLRMMHDALQLGPSLVAWTSKSSAPAEPLALAQLSGALETLGDRARAASAMSAAIRDVTEPHAVAWWVAWSYWSSLRDAAGILAVAAETDQLAAVQPILPQMQKMSRTPDLLTTQEKAWLLSATHAISVNDPAIELAVDGKPVEGSKGQAALLPDASQVAAGYTVENRSRRDLYRSIVVRGAPKNAPTAMAEGVSLTKRYLDMDGQKLDPARLKQNQRFIVLLSGKTGDTALHHLAVVDLLPAGWEIEAALLPDQAPDFLPRLNAMRLREARDDRLVAAVDVGVHPWNDSEEDEDSSNDDADKDKRKDASKEGGFSVAYIARAVTPGRFALPEAVVEDMYRPDTTARTEDGTTMVESP